MKAPSPLRREMPTEEETWKKIQSAKNWEEIKALLKKYKEGK